MITKNLPTKEQWINSLSAANLTPDETEKAGEIYNRLISTLDRYIPTDFANVNVNVTAGLFFDSGGSQYIAEAAVSDLARPAANEYNWHLQNTSQWLFACGIVFDKNRRDFSMHT